MGSSTLVQEGIAAYKAGQKEEAVRLLKDALREDQNDDRAWLYLGLALDDGDYKRKAFERAVQINPENVEARQALSKLKKSASGAKPAASAARKEKMGGAASAAGGGSTSNSPKSLKDLPFANVVLPLPVKVDGAPEKLTIGHLLEAGQAGAEEGLNLYTKPGSGSQPDSVRAWEPVLLAIVATVAVGAGIFVGQLFALIYFIGRFGRFFTFSMVLSPFLAAIAAMLGMAAAFAVAAVASQQYLKNEKVEVDLPKHALYYARLAMPIALVQAALTLVAYVLGIVISLHWLTTLAVIGLSAYAWYLLSQDYQRLYGNANRGMITAALAVGGGFATNLLVVAILSSILRITF